MDDAHCKVKKEGSLFLFTSDSLCFIIDLEWMRICLI